MQTDNHQKDWKKERQKIVMRQRLILAGTIALLLFISIGAIFLFRSDERRWQETDASVAAEQAKTELLEMEKMMQAEEADALIAEEESYPDPDKFIALTFDDGPGPYTERLLDELNARDIKATFFLLGSQAKKYPELVKRIADDGHELGSHTYSHKDLTALKEKEIKKELEKSAKAISTAAGGQAPTVFRPPGGECDETITKICKEYEYPIILWSVDPKDWKLKDPDEIVKNVFQSGNYGVSDGAIILLHDIYETTVDAVVDMIERLMQEGYGFMTVSDLINTYENEYLPGEIYRRAEPPEK